MEIDTYTSELKDRRVCGNLVVDHNLPKKWVIVKLSCFALQPIEK